jgi:hypothetical protein
VPWSGADFADTSLVFALGATRVPSPRAATVFHAGLAPWRYGPLRIAATWSFVSVRAPAGQSFGLGDPKIYARLRVVGRDTTAARLWIDGMARVPTAQAKLFPYAWGGQEVELGASAALVRTFAAQVGGAYAWLEPGAGAAVTRADVPHTVRAYAFLRRAWGAWVPQLRFDRCWLDRAGQRSLVEAGVTRRQEQGVDVTVAGGLEIGPRGDRAVESWLHLRFATRLR